MSTSIDDLKQQYIKTFEKDMSYVHRDDLDELVQKMDDVLKSIADQEARIVALETA